MKLYNMIKLENNVILIINIELINLVSQCFKYQLI